MSPTEDELRAALHHGSGAGVDVERILAQGKARRRQRRTRWQAAAAAVVVVGAIGTGVGVVVSADPHPTAAPGRGTAAFGAGGGDAAGASPEVAANCPEQLPQLGSGAGSGHFFTKPVGSVTVCGYKFTGLTIVRSAGTRAPLTASYAGADASAIVTSLEKAPSQPTGASCGAIPASGLNSILLLARYADGTNADPIIAAAGPCEGPVRNGHITRYNWSPPAPVSGFIQALRAAAAGTGGPVASPSH